MSDAFRDLDRLATASLDDIEEARASFWAVPRMPQDHMVFSRTLTIPDTEDETGQLEQYDPASHPGQWHLMKALDGDYGPYREFTVLADTQSGKSWAMQVDLFHTTIERGIKAILGLPNRNLGGDIWTTKLRPAIFGAGLDVYLPLEGPASRAGSAPRTVPFRRVSGRGGGLIQFMSGCGRGEAGQASLTARVLYIDELDDWQRDAVERIERRLDKFLSSAQRRIFRATTVKADSYEASTGLQYYEDTCKAVLEFECVHCGEHTAFLWEHFDHDAATVLCEHCKTEINDEQRKRMLVKHRLRMANPEHRYFGLRWTALDCPWKALVDLGGKFQSALKAQEMGVHQPMKQFFRDQRVEPYEDDLEVRNVERSHLAGRSARSSYDRGMAPDWAEFLVYAIDVQMDRCYWVALAGSREGRFAIVDWNEVYYQHTEEGVPVRKAEPTDGQRTWTLDEVADALIQGDVFKENGDALPAILGGVDIGYKPEAIGPWVRGRGADMLAVRGDKAAKGGRIGKQSRLNSGHAVKSYNGGLLVKRRQERKPGMPRDWWFVKSADTRDRVRAGLLLDPDKAGAIQLPRGVGSSDDLARHLACYRLETDAKDPSLSVWVKRGTREDYEDCLIYAWNLARYAMEHRLHMRIRDEDDEPEAPEPARPVAIPAPPSPGGDSGFIPL